jgi:histone H3/H4
MTNMPPDRNPLQKIIQQADAQLQDIESSPFSPSAFSVLKEKISEYIVELVSESIKVSKRHQADTVSSAHVERASEYLISSTSRRFFRHLGTIGGILFGAALSNIVAMTAAQQYSTAGILLSAGLGIAGAFMVAFHIAKD